MKIKKKIKKIVRYCALCGIKFDNYAQKHSHKVRLEKKYSLYNIIILCVDCKNKLIKENIQTCEIYLHDNYLSCLGEGYANKIINRLVELRGKY